MQTPTVKRLVCICVSSRLVVGLIVAGVVASTALASYEPEVTVHYPKMHCKAEGRYGYCTSEDVGQLRTIWTLYDEPIYDAEGGKHFRFLSPKDWTVVELAVIDSDGDVQRLRAEVKRVHDKAIFRAYQPTS